MVVIGAPDASWAFEADAVLGIERIHEEDLGPPPVTVRYALADFTLGVTQIGGRIVTVLDGDRVLRGFQAGLA